MSTHLCFNLLCLAPRYNIYINIFFWKLPSNEISFLIVCFQKRNFSSFFDIFFKISTFTTCWMIKNLFTFHFLFSDTKISYIKFNQQSDYDEVTKLDWILFMIFFFTDSVFMNSHFLYYDKASSSSLSFMRFFSFALLFSAIFLI